MARHHGSISLRLAVGFALALGALGLGLLLTLNRFSTVRKAAQRVRLQLEVREQAIQTEKVAQDLLAAHGEMLAPPGPNAEAWERFRSLFSELEYLTDGLWARRSGMPERELRPLEELHDGLAALRSLLQDVGLRGADGGGLEGLPPEHRVRLRARGRQALGEVLEGGRDLRRFAYVLMAQAATDAETSWNLTVAVAKVVLPLALLAAIVVIYYTHRSVVQPIEALVEGTKKVASGQFDQRIDVRGAAEFNQLAESFNRMAVTLESNQQSLVEAEKLVTVGRLAAGVAHEINNPITVIIGYAKMLQGQLDDNEEARQQLEDIAQEAQQCKRIVESLLDLARPSESTPGEVINPSELIAEVVNMTQALQLWDRVRVERSVIDRPIPLTISRVRLRQMTLNIIRNGLEELQNQPDGRLRIEGYVRPRGKVASRHLRQSGARSSSFLILAFTDNGPGIPQEHLEHLFEPFFTTKAEGMGLGLAICQHIASSHGGFIHVEAAPEEGTTFMVGLPVADHPR